MKHLLLGVAILLISFLGTILLSILIENVWDEPCCQVYIRVHSLSDTFSEFGLLIACPFLF